METFTDNDRLHKDLRKICKLLIQLFHISMLELCLHTKAVGVCPVPKGNDGVLPLKFAGRVNVHLCNNGHTLTKMYAHFNPWIPWKQHVTEE